MTAINLVCSKRLNAAFITADAARYEPSGIVSSFTTKVFTMPHWPGATAVRGAAVASHILGDELANAFATFDDAVAGIETKLPEMVEAWPFLKDRPVELLLAGWSTERNAPESYVINTTSDLPVCTTADEAEAAEHLPPPFTLHRLPDRIDGPAVLDTDMIIAANWEGIDESSAASVSWSMLKFMEMQRQADYGDGVHWIGGFCQLATITPHGISQTILTRWDEDTVGEWIRPTPIDWDEWHAANPKPVPNTPIQLSRVRQDMLDRKQRKALR